MPQGTIVILYAFYFKLARSEVWSSADGFHQFGREDGNSPGFHSSLFQRFVAVVGSVRPEVAFQVIPQVLHRVQLGTVRR